MRALLRALLHGALSLLTAMCLISLSSTAATPRSAAPASGFDARSQTRSVTVIPASTTTRHYIANVKEPEAVVRLGFNVIDTGTSDGQIDALPDGAVAMVWLGQKCPTRINRSFRAVVRRLSSNPRVYGYYLSDEPHIGDCPKGPVHLKVKARYIHQASGGRQKAFIVLSNTVPRSYHAFRPAASGVDLVGINPYPCSVVNPHCRYVKIRLRVRQAVSGGIPRRQIVPSFQAFGQEEVRRIEGGSYYQLPAGYQMTRMLRIWARLVPHPRLDFTYGWDHQASSNPTLVNSHVLQQVLSRYFHR